MVGITEVKVIIHLQMNLKQILENKSYTILINMENTIMANKGEAKLKKFLITLGIVLGTFPVRAEFCDSVSPKEVQKIIGYLQKF